MHFYLFVSPKHFKMTPILQSVARKIFPAGSLMLLCLLMSALTTSVFAQQTTVSGTVKGSDGSPIGGVTVQEAGTQNGTATDANGGFTLTVSKPDASLSVSSLGYNTQTIPLAGKTTVNVTLAGAAAQQLEQVVVIGYGTANKRDLTGSIVKVAGKEVADKPNTNPVASLQGKVAGLSVVNSGRPGQEPDIRLRGTVSRTQTKPLYIVDGIFNDNIDYVNPNDIESIEILKDASSLAIFGVRGANGAIIITTKKGRTGKPVVSFNTSIGFQKMVDKIALTDATGYKLLIDEQRANQGVPSYPYFNLYNGNSDWQELISQTGLVNINNVSLSSGTDRNKFYMGVGYTYQEGIIKSELLRKYTLTLNDELKAAKFLKVGFDVNGYYARLPQTFDFQNALTAAPVITPFNEQFGVYNQTPVDLQDAQVGNPLRTIVEHSGQELSDVYRAVGNVFAEFTFTKSLTFKATYYGDMAFNANRGYTPLVNLYNAVLDTIVNTNSKTQVHQRDNRFTKFQQEYLLTFKNNFGDHGLTLLGGFSTNYNAYHETNAEASQFTTGNATPIPNNPRFWYLDNFFVDPGSRVKITPDDDLFGNPPPYEWEQTTVSMFGRALYNYQNKYLLNASFRRDGSSDISPKNRYQNFVAVGAGWEVSREPFMTDSKLFDYLKLKASWGILGNQYTAIHYPFYPQLTSEQSAIFGPSGDQQVISAYAPSYIADPNLKWETITSTDLGVEFSILKNRLKAEFGYYNKITDDLLTNFPSLNGQKPGITNAGKITNHGIELLLSWADKFKNGFGYSLSGNLTTFNNKVNSVFKPGYEIFDGPTRTRAGDPIGSFYGYIVDGIYQNSQDSASSPNSGYSPGEFKFRDISGPDGKPDGIITPEDRTIIGNPTPDFSYGFSVGVELKGLYANVDFQGVSGNQIFRTWGNGAGYARLNYRAARLNRWHGEGTSNFEPWVNDNAQTVFLNSTYMIEDGSYLRIRNVELGYNFPANFLSRLAISSARLYLNGQNLKTFKHNSGYTPEFGGSALQFGVDNGSYPVPAIYTLGLNLTF